MDGLLIRAYRTDDGDEVVRLWNECGLVVPWNDPVRDIERKLKNDPERFLVGVLDGKVAATCMAGYEGHRGWINYLAVSPALRRRGIASRMMREAEDLLKKAGCPKINLQVRASNTPVRRFLQKHRLQARRREKHG
jgi:ribosomal protein S18 acetylase RimI-like enzyme